MTDDRFSDFDDVDWTEEQLAVVMRGADYGIPEAKAELRRREKLIDTVSAKALSVEWIQE